MILVAAKEIFEVEYIKRNETNLSFETNVQDFKLFY